MDWWGTLWRDMVQGQTQMGDMFKWMGMGLTMMGQSAYEDYLRMLGLAPNRQKEAEAAKLDDLMATLAAREEQIGLQDERIAELQGLSDHHKKDLDDQKKRNAVQARTITTQKKQMEKLKGEVADLKARLSEQKKEIGAQKKQLAAQLKEMAGMEKAPSSKGKAGGGQKRSRTGSEKGLSDTAGP
jgi:DNA repair ATPase RecN